jgi:hypothetical protein
MTNRDNRLRIVSFGGLGALDNGIEVELRRDPENDAAITRRVTVTIPGSVLRALAEKALQNLTGKAVIGGSRSNSGGIIARRTR